MRKRAGFTLVEVMVALSILLVIVSVAVGSYAELNRRQAVEQTAKRILSDMRLAQSMAINQQKPKENEGACGTLNGYFFNVDLSNKSYTIDPDCSNPPFPSDNHAKSVSLSDSGIVLTGFTKVTFGRTSTQVTASGGNTLTVSSSKSPIVRKITFGDRGDITIQ